MVIETAATSPHCARPSCGCALQRIGHIGDFDYDIAKNCSTISGEYRVLHGLSSGETTMTLGRWLDLVHPEDRARAVAVMQGTATSGAPIDVTLRIIRLTDAETRWIASRAEVIRGPDGSPRRVVGTVQDVTDRMEAERRRSLVVRELNHRVKNMLTVVQSVVAQTLRGTRGDPARFAHDLGGRLQALARAHDLLTANDWTGALGTDAPHGAWLEAETDAASLGCRDWHPAITGTGAGNGHGSPCNWRPTPPNTARCPAQVDASRWPGRSRATGRSSCPGPSGAAPQ